VRRVAGVDVTITALDEPKRVLGHARQATPYRLGRVLLAGDAAHVHSPNGGQGLNLGLMDATNLGWKLAASLRRPGPFADELLDSYTAERHPVAAAVLHNTRAQSALLAPGPHTDALRDIMSELMDLPQVNAYFAELMSGLHARYPLPYPTDGHPLLGAHCPDLAFDGSTVYAHTAGGQAVLLAPADEPGVARAAAPWADRTTIVAAAELDRDDLTGLLLRPDGIVAWTAAPDRPADTTALRTALNTWLGDPGERGRLSSA
jgi:FAD binding domain